MSLDDGGWRELGRDDLGFLNTLNSVFSSAQRRDPRCFPRLHQADCLFVGSDYGGDHQNALYQTLTFLIADVATCARWIQAWAPLRKRLLPDRRRMAYKSLNDGLRARALYPLLDTANRLPGLLVTFVFARAIRSVFSADGQLDTSQLEFAPLREFSAPLAERLMRVVHVLSLLLAGLSAPGQDVLWVTDEDNIAANPARVQHLCDALAVVSSHCLSHSLRHLRVATTKQDCGDLSLEDLLAIPDLAAGALASIMDVMLGARGAPLRGFWLPPVQDVSGKARRVLNWFSDATQPLRRFVVLIDETLLRQLRATHLRFHGSNDSLGLRLDYELF
jgi:hypothetical protein